jgi:hypothetical protein
MLFSRHYYSPLNTFIGKVKDPDPYLALVDPEGPKTCDTGFDGCEFNWTVYGNQY